MSGQEITRSPIVQQLREFEDGRPHPEDDFNPENHCCVWGGRKTPLNGEGVTDAAMWSISASVNPFYYTTGIFFL